MSVTREELDQARLDLEEKILKIANLHADTNLKEAQKHVEPWKVVISAFAAGGAVVGATAAATLLIARELGH